ncbi:MAG: thermonuclease family protein [Candidatus Dadabacteria bacterium]|nr:MAG: thermonuclease family protein [Candidatus Dadabacteria bacterium]
MSPESYSALHPLAECGCIMFVHYKDRASHVIVFFLISLSILSCTRTQDTPAVTITGKVIKVFDGDTVLIRKEAEIKKVRLYAIDCPEKGQLLADKARDRLRGLVWKKEVVIVPHGQDKYNRLLADIVLKSGKNVSDILVSEGLCYWYRHFAPERTDLSRLQSKARQKKLGLWALKKAVLPWSYRQKLKHHKKLKY